VGESDLELSVISVCTESTVLQGACQEGFGRTGFTVLQKNSTRCHSERSEESLFDLSDKRETKRDSSLRSE
jgi:hypothetical protein